MHWSLQFRPALFERSLAGLEWVARKRGRQALLAPHLQAGAAGETAAYFYLANKGYLVVERGWTSRSQRGDLDLIAWQGTLLCFVEVKTRTARDNSPAEIRVDAHKRTILRRLARQYMHQLPQETYPQVRFDVISVYLVPGKQKEIVHFENAFGWQERREDEWR
jgi:putative endonuclease